MPFSPERLRQARKLAGVSMPKLVEVTGIDLASVSLYENGHRVPTILTAERLADALGVTLDDLCEREVASVA